MSRKKEVLSSQARGGQNSVPFSEDLCCAWHWAGWATGPCVPLPWSLCARSGQPGADTDKADKNRVGFG
jgi:hypothetical protein